MTTLTAHSTHFVHTRTDETPAVASASDRFDMPKDAAEKDSSLFASVNNIVAYAHCCRRAASQLPSAVLRQLISCLNASSPAV